MIGIAIQHWESAYKKKKAASGMKQLISGL